MISNWWKYGIALKRLVKKAFICLFFLLVILEFFLFLSRFSHRKHKSPFQKKKGELNSSNQFGKKTNKQTRDRKKESERNRMTGEPRQNDLPPRN